MHRREAFALQPHKGGDQDGVIALHVLRAAAVKITVLLAEFERVEGPIRTQRFDYVEVAEEQDRREGVFAAITDDQVAFARRRCENVDVTFRKSRGAESSSH